MARALVLSVRGRTHRRRVRWRTDRHGVRRYKPTMTPAMSSTHLFLAGAAFLAFLVLMTVLVSFLGRWRWARCRAALLSDLHSSHQPRTLGLVDWQELQGLPAPVQRYLRAVLKEGQALPAAVELTQDGTMNLQADGDAWKPFSATQRAQMHRPGFVWDARLTVFPGLQVHVHDAYVSGVGSLHAAVMGAVPVARLKGSDHLAQAELMRWLAEAAWYPTALLPSQGVHWLAVDKQNADASITDGHVTVSLRFHFDSDGLVDTVTAASRSRLVGKVDKPAPWQGRFWNYAWREGMRVPQQGEVAWMLPGGASPYWRGRITALRVERPGEADQLAP